MRGQDAPPKRSGMNMDTAGPQAGLARAGQPWRCLCLGLVQITITLPWRRITRHLSHIFLTEARTFMGVVLSEFANEQPTTWVNCP